MFASWKKINNKPRQCIKKQGHYFAYKGPYSQSYDFSSRHVWIWELDNKKGWVSKNYAFKLWCWRRLLRVSWTVNPKGNQPWTLIGRTDTEAEATILWPPDVNSQLIRKDPDAGKDWGQEEKATTKDEMVGWHHQLSGQESEQTLGDHEEQARLVCYSPWGCNELDTTEWLNINMFYPLNIKYTHLIYP